MKWNAAPRRATGPNCMQSTPMTATRLGTTVWSPCSVSTHWTPLGSAGGHYPGRCESSLAMLHTAATSSPAVRPFVPLRFAKHEWDAFHATRWLRRSGNGRPQRCRYSRAQGISGDDGIASNKNVLGAGCTLRSSQFLRRRAAGCSCLHGVGSGVAVGSSDRGEVEGHSHNDSSTCSSTNAHSHAHEEHEHHHSHAGPASACNDHSHNSDRKSHNHGGHSHSHCGHGHHGHGHCTEEDYSKLNVLQKGVFVVAKITKLTWTANLLRESVVAVCLSFGLCLVAAASPSVLGQVKGAQWQNWILTVAFPLTAIPALLDSTMDLAGGRINIHVLMALAAFASIFMGNALEGCLLLAMFALSHRAEEYFTERALRDTRDLHENSPQTALLVAPFDPTSPPPLSAMKYTEVPVANVAIGDCLLVRTGEAVPVDGEVCLGRSTVTVEHLTGETQPLLKSLGDEVPGGARNTDGLLIIRATKQWDDSTVARIAQLTREASANRPTLQRWLDRFSERYSQVVVAAAVAVAVLTPHLMGIPFFSTGSVRGSLYRALCVMVAASPCALAVAPLAYAAAVSSCAMQGILLRGGRALDALAVCDTVGFDKTGTLTTGHLRCQAIEPILGHQQEEGSGSGNADEDREGGRSISGDDSDAACCLPNCRDKALAVAAAMERAASHPIARAVVEHSEGKLLPAVAVTDFESIPGHGVRASITTTIERDGPDPIGPERAHLGSLDYVTAQQATSESRQLLQESMLTSASRMDLIQAALAVGPKVTLFSFEDQVRLGTPAVVRTLLHRARMRVMMLTGDRMASARRVADAVGISELYAGLKPEDKLRHAVQWSQQEGRGGLVMVGDGINDAPALAAATVGIVLAARASATAIAAADVILLRDSIEGVPFVIAKAQQTCAVVQQSVALALGCIVLGIFPALLGFLPLWLTVLLHEGGTLLVCLNSLRAFNSPSWGNPGQHAAK